MIDRAAVGALGVVVAGLALAALADQPRVLPPRASVKPAPISAPQPPAVRALRDGSTLDLNSAGAGDLELLPGIGRALAQRIVTNRTAAGPFQSVHDLVRVRGIGPRTLQRLYMLVRVEPVAGQGRGGPQAAPSLVEHPRGRGG